MRKYLVGAAAALTLSASFAMAQDNADNTLCVEFEPETYFCTDNTRRMNDRTSDSRRSLSTSGFIITNDGTRFDDCKLHTLRNGQVMKNGAECRPNDIAPS